MENKQLFTELTATEQENLSGGTFFWFKKVLSYFDKKYDYKKYDYKKYDYKKH